MVKEKFLYNKNEVNPIIKNMLNVRKASDASFESK